MLLSYLSVWHQPCVDYDVELVRRSVQRKELCKCRSQDCKQAFEPVQEHDYQLELEVRCLQPNVVKPFLGYL